jgi:predicted SnoaL-like aldol condensation-catalyzing enzyme
MSTDGNTHTVTAFWNVVMQENHIPQAIDQYFVGLTDVRHRELIEYFARIGREEPRRQVSVATIAGQDDFVLLYWQQTPSADRERSSLDVFRLDAGKITEHWSVLQDVPVGSAKHPWCEWFLQSDIPALLQWLRPLAFIRRHA